MTDALAGKTIKSVINAPPAADDSEGMQYLETLPRRLVTLYLPLFLFLIVLLFPFYWMALTAIKPDDQLLDVRRHHVPPRPATATSCRPEQISALGASASAVRFCRSTA